MGDSKGAEAQASRVLQVLDALAKTPQASVKQLAEATMIPPSTMYRLLAPLVASGFARKTSHRKYCAGPIAVQLAERYHDAEPATGLVTPYLRRLAETSGELAAFMVVRGTEAVCVDEVESSHTLRASYSVGAAVPLLRGATATALLSRMPAASRGSILEHYKVPSAQRKHIEASCAQAQADGYAVSTGELDPGIWGVSVPVLDGQDQLAGALTLMAPSERSSHREEELIELVRGTADALSEGMQ
ncbi:IclR family transcriptional regulator [Arthrobacter sp. AQ5-05]|uniref:IclR family transcriptional regulator n=1 Tax=Arthrobacter sp. AQ5-05 TaxID=2184581 RepID=UPI0015EB7A00|nr:IclR family transcriptional regulator [Arthrobacter sp. AQ5-05]